MMVVLKLTSTPVTFLEPQTHNVLPHILCKNLLVTTKNSFHMLRYVERNIYMVDLYVSSISLEGAQNMLQGLRNVFSKKGFNLTERNSSNPKFLNSLESEIRLHPENALPQNHKVLGLPWNAALGCYVIESKLLQKSRLQAT